MTPVRISTTSYLIARAADVIGFPAPAAGHPGADATWSPLAEYGHDTQPAPEQLAIADVPYRIEHYPPLGELVIGPLEPARIYDTLAGGIR